MIREYTLFAATGIVLTVLLELLVLRTGLFRDLRYWVALAIVAAFQLLVNGVLTCPPIVSYDPAEILGPRIVCAPIEDLGFGFAMVTTTIALWRRSGGAAGAAMETVEVGGLRIAYRRAGSGPVLVLVHGALGDSRDWRWQLEGLGGELTVVAWDAPGCGGSDDPPATFRLADFADCLAGFVAALGIERPHVLRAVVRGRPGPGAVPAAPAGCRGRWCWRRPMPAGRGRCRPRSCGSGWSGPTARPAAARAVGPRLPARAVHRIGPAGAAGGGGGDHAGRPPGRDAGHGPQLRRRRPARRPAWHPGADPAAVRRRRPAVPAGDGRRRAAPDDPRVAAAVMPGVGHAANMEAPERFNDEVREFLRSVP